MSDTFLADHIIALENEETRLRARIEALETALRGIARQYLSSEMDEDQQEGCEYEGGYNTVVMIARASLGPETEK